MILRLLYLAGLAGVSSEDVHVAIDGYTYGSLSMTAYTLGLPAPAMNGGRGAPLPPPGDVPADDTNM